MKNPSEIFQKHREEYSRQIAEIDPASVKHILGLKQKGDQFFLPFFDREYLISKNGIREDSGAIPDYVTSVILSRYLLLCPDRIYQDEEWTAFKDFKRTAQFVNTNYFASDTEKAIVSAFAEKPEQLDNACRKLGGISGDENFAYDLVMRFEALPRISLLLLFNEGDGDFPAYATVLFQKHAEYYLDPESLAMTSAHLAGKLKNMPADQG